MNWSLSNLSLFLTAWLYGQLLWCLFCQPSLNFIIFERVAWIFFKISLFVFHWRNKVKQVWGNNWIRFHFWVNYCYRFTGQKNLFVSEKLQIVQDWQSVKRSKVKSSKVKFYLYITFPNIFSFKAPFLKIGAYKFPSEHSKGNCGKKKKLLLQVLWQGQVFSFSSTKRTVNLWSHLPVKSIFVCRDVSCDKLSDVRALAAHKFAITLVPSVPQCTLGNISWALSDWNSV